MSAHRLRRFFLVLSILLSLLAASGCSFGGGQQAKPAPDEDEIKDMIKEEMDSPETKETIETAVRETAGTVRAEDLLTAPETQKLMQEQVAKLLATPEGQKALQEQLKKTMEGPEMQQSLQMQVKQALLSLLSGSGGGQSGGQSGGKSGGQSGSSSGGSDS